MRGLLDEGSLREVAKAAGAQTLDAEGNMVDFTPANYALGTGNSVPEYVPDDHYFAMIRACHDARQANA